MDSQLMLTLVVRLFDFLDFLIQAYNFVFFIWILASWFPIDRSIPIMRFIDGLIMPIYCTLLKILPPLRLGMIDFSPFYMILFLQLSQWLVIFLRVFVITGLNQIL
ncbi:MAG: YggT family protein [Brevinemataceae bacterium]